jgi:hypothetical protein
VNPNLSRRRLLVLGGLVLLGCKKDDKPATCTDTSQLSKQDADSRMLLGYVEPAPSPAMQCAKCAQYIEAPSAGACGGCKVLKGPISPAGYCKVFAPKS